ncbi:hypothetical protein [Phaeobacter gallaeciensis]|uniref:Uncharacterized protein n=1 Tax=Phaeobacter gallaeciensis TaxID=60890 RepID=A0AAD0ECK2_9RHOB|nr:hypothetical protein [Phaeobacter gallaeciensis]AHD10850.1 hypothetical protein Gal_03122 [Phaeobacter gallaeciensis DSM 26640]ATE94113.1 hypothetical protein PhaeoP11_03110 [Phaeobacter gallaeciensis]ATE96066.1 hypothetical protein PhaeoP73_00737 [Phaeobacter gallaeciensis]ATF02777.1 hypothetical protein PhaeoP75_03159 [Phaeobacter gallaeciensis]ATF07157.1 hypothetical protein PhaeoP63_03108 [Phaeobacter gallaeciensis]
MTDQAVKQIHQTAANSATSPKVGRAAEALAHLEQAWAYYVPEPRAASGAIIEPATTEGVVDYYAAA